jgi:hypothetical protein
MKLAPPSAPRPRLLSDITAEDWPEVPAAARSVFRISLSARAVFIGLSVGLLLLLCAAGHLYNQHQRAIGAQPFSLIQFVRTLTKFVSSSERDLISHTSAVENFDPTVIHVSAIALGQPRMAVINGQSVAEGEYVRVRTENPDAPVLLRVLKIADRQVVLSDGVRTLTADFGVLRTLGNAE